MIKTTQVVVSEPKNCKGSSGTPSSSMPRNILFVIGKLIFKTQQYNNTILASQTMLVNQPVIMSIHIVV